MNEIIKNIEMQSNKVFLLPKLKSTYEQKQKTKTISSYSNLATLHTKPCQDQQQMNNRLSRQEDVSSQLNNNNNNKQTRSRSTNFGVGNLKIQYKYISRSPEYFKRKERSLQTLEPSPYGDNTPMQKYIGQKMRKFNKDSLIDLAKQGMYRNMNYKHKVIPKKKSPHQIYFQVSESPASPTNETKYSAFNPSKIVPMMHSLKKVYPSIAINR